VRGSRKHVQAYLKDFLFDPSLVDARVGTLSGGEQSRLLLAREFARTSNLLVLDEPTNDLDLETLDLLQEMLADYGGTVLLVSHDRDFLDRVVTATLASEGNGRWIVYAGGYSDMIAQRGENAPESAKTPKPKAPEKKNTPPAAPKSQRPGLTFKEKHILEKLPARLDGLQAEIEKHKAILADSGLYARDPGRFETVAAALRDAEKAHEEAEEEWLALEMKREAAEGA
jgi:ATP-binding cassette subfamily F protein uup